MTRKVYFSSLILGLAIVLGGCSLIAQPANVQTESPVVTIKGKISVAGPAKSIVSGNKVILIESRKIDLEKYNGQTVTVVGQYSGTVLYVDEVK